MKPNPWVPDEKQMLQLVQPAAVFGIALAASLLVRHLALAWMKRRARTHPASAAAVVFDSIRFPSILWALAAALAVSLEFANLTKWQADVADQWIGAFVIISLTLVAASSIVRMLSAYGERQGMPFAAAGLTRTLIRIVIIALGVMTLLAHFGKQKQITPLLTALGVGGLAVALALQDTLANFFAGIHILVERPIFVGDTIRLENGQEGVVTDIGWRTTRVHTAGNDMVVVPNTKITSGILVNYSLPDSRGVAEVQIVASHSANAAHVRSIVLEEAAACPGVMADPAPLFLFDPGVLPTHMQAKLIVNVSARAQAGKVASDIRMKLLERFRAEGIPLPDPALAPQAGRS